MRDLSPSGHVLGGAVLVGLPATVSLGDVLRIRITGEVSDYNREPDTVFTGLVQPEDSVRLSRGHRLKAPRVLDADHMIAAAEEAVAAGMLAFVIDGEAVADLTQQIDLDDHAEITVVLQRPVVASAG